MLALFIGGPELIFIIFVVVLIFGTDKVPMIARELGNVLRTIRQTTSDIQHEITKEDLKDEVCKIEPNDDSVSQKKVKSEEEKDS